MSSFSVISLGGKEAGQRSSLRKYARLLYGELVDPVTLVLLIPLLFWLLLISSYEYIPSDMKRSIDVNTLAFIDEMITGTNSLHRLFPQSDFLIILAAIPYLFHFLIPFVYSFYLIRFSRVSPVVFLFYFGMINGIGVLMQIILPTAPPWYMEIYGTEPANYTIQPDPGNLSRLDEITGTNLIQILYGNNPIVFGSCPSLHFAWPLLILIYEFITTKSIPMKFLSVYCLWVGWAAIYTRHHFLIDLITSFIITIYCSLFVGELLAYFGISKSKNLSEIPSPPMRNRRYDYTRFV